MYTVELYKADKRVKNGERLVRKSDHSVPDRVAIETVYSTTYPASKGYRFAIFETMVTRTNHMTGLPFKERYDTPYFCSPRSETYFSS